MTRLSLAALGELGAAGISRRTWVREWDCIDPGCSGWHGDVCGCPDDRCVGYHHDEGEECGCLTVLIADHVARKGRAVHLRGARGADAAVSASGGFETELEAIEACGVRGWEPGSYGWRSQAALLEACAAAGVQLGAYDARIVDWMARTWEPQAVAALAGIIARAGGSL